MSVPLADSNSPTADGDAAPYRAVSRWAVGALALGLLSPLAFVGPLLWLVPMACAVAALWAMWNISSSGGELIGWNIALLGLILALLFGVAAPVHTLSRRYWLESGAESFVKEFVDLLEQKRPFAAFQLTLSPPLRKPLDSDAPADDAKDPQARQKYEKFLQVEPAPTILAQNNHASVEKLDSQWLSSDEESDQVVVRYRFLKDQASAAAPLVIQFSVVHFMDDRTRRQEWRIRSSDILR